MSHILTKNSHAAKLNAAIEDPLLSGAQGVPFIDLKNGNSLKTLYGAQRFGVMETLLATIKNSSKHQLVGTYLSGEIYENSYYWLTKKSDCYRRFS